MTAPFQTSSPNLGPASQAGGDAVVTLRHIDLHLGQGPHRLEVLRTIDLDLALGDFVCVLGSSGCGKTSLLRVIAGYQAPTNGVVYVDGQVHTAPNAQVGVVFQRPNLLPWLSIADNVDFGPKMQGVPGAERQQRVDHYLDSGGPDGSQAAAAPPAFWGYATAGGDRPYPGRQPPGGADG
jgi:ABC-type nitrate/sulfonate/bicarbonate transport system ATPase subunit